MKDILERIKWARFTTTDEVFLNRKEIRKHVQQFDNETLEVYKWYFFFQLCMLKNPLKEKMWNFLVKETISINEDSDLCALYRNYKEKCRKISEYQRKKDKEKGIKIEEIDKRPTITITCVEDLFKI